MVSAVLSQTGEAVMLHSPHEVCVWIHPYSAEHIYKHLFPGFSQALIGKEHFQNAPTGSKILLLKRWMVQFICMFWTIVHEHCRCFWEELHCEKALENPFMTISI